MLRKRVLFVLALMQSFCHAPVRLQSTVPGRKLGTDAEAGVPLLLSFIFLIAGSIQSPT